jgi:SAM-dependent methyltransferase
VHALRVLDEDRLEERAMALSGSTALMDDTRAAFDSVASTYDRSNAENPILCEMRRRTLFALQAHVRSGARVLDLGCGPGCDDESLVRAGYLVTAVDCSSEMVAQARRRIRVARLEDAVDVHALGIQELDRLPAAAFDAAYSSFGPLNCVPDLPHAARLIADRVRPGGVFVASVIGRICPWEIGVFLGRGDWTRARVRFAPGFVPVPLNRRTVWTRYYSPSLFTQIFEEAGFARVSLRALGLLVPPPYMQAFASRHPSLVAALQRIEDRVAHWPGFRAGGDHFLIVMKRG